jgi:hypothetical protein
LKTFLKQIFRFLGSYGLACMLFVLLLLLTYLGTLHQVAYGLYTTQQKFFESLFLVYWIAGWIPLPLPGGGLLLGLLFINLLAGGVIRARKNWRKLGVLTAHIGILVLLAGSYITWQYSESGRMVLHEGESLDYFEAYHDWEVAVTETGADGPATESIIPNADFESLTGAHRRKFLLPDAPFDLVLSRFTPNSQPRRFTGGDPANAPAPVASGFYLEALPQERESGRNAPGIYVTVTEAETSVREAILWGVSMEPLVYESGSRQWTIELRRARYYLSFRLRLDEFIRELHPGTTLPSTFESQVTKIEKDSMQQYEITMNEPLRYQGYTFYQSSWGPADAAPGVRLYSVLAVVRNPADQFPLYASLIITAGMCFHFMLKLLRYLRKESAKK